jgi:DNA helicase-2/ATP-dependent DNA helicase PcrA
MENSFTNQQNDIIDCDKNLVVIAKPGSGKTTTISYKASKIISSLKDYQGIIAISFTKKASNELKEKILKQCDNVKGSFFGTIDKFNLNEIIFPFVKHIFSFIPSNEFDVIFLNSIPENEKAILNKYLEDLMFGETILNIIRDHYKQGKIIMELNGFLANYILDNCIACKQYLTSKYTHVFIDEYQDCDHFQNEIFKKLINLNLIGIAVGDPEQSIFKFAGKDSKFLTDLASDSNFIPLPLDINHRSHKSIVDYSLKFLNKEHQIDYSQDRRVKILRIDGSEKQVAEIIDQKIIEKIKLKFNITLNYRIAILVTNNRTAELIKNNFNIHKLRYIMTTPLDESISLLDNIFIEILKFILDKDYMFYDFKNNINIYEENLKSSTIIAKKLENLRGKFSKDNSIELLDIVNISELILETNISNDQILNLKQVIENKDYLYSFSPIHEDEIVIITIYKAKGMEFDVVFHLNLDEYILPKKIRNSSGNFEYSDIKQCTHLHYVALTRAKEFCFLITSTKRTNWEGKIIDANPSEFVIRKDLLDYSNN